MKTIRFVLAILLFCLILSACSQAETSPTTIIETAPPIETSPTSISTPTDPPPPIPTQFSTNGWSTTASTKTELSFAFPGNWDGSSPLTFGEGEFVKDPDLPIGVTFQIGLQGSPDTLLNSWGSSKIGIVGISTFTPETITDGPEIIIARLTLPTKIAIGEGVTAQVAYIQRSEDVMEVMWFAPSDQWTDLQETFSNLRDRIELWKKYPDYSIGLQTMYVHDWQKPAQTWQDTGLWFKSEDEQSGLAIFEINEIADPIEYLNAWNTDQLSGLNLSDCTIGKGDRMDSMGGQWESKTGTCKDANDVEITYEVSYIPNKDRLLEMITYCPSETWEVNTQVAFRHLLGMMGDIR
jgi:hypothetical protein